MLRPWDNFVQEQYIAPQKAVLLLGLCLTQKLQWGPALLQTLLEVVEAP